MEAWLAWRASWLRSTAQVRCRGLLSEHSPVHWLPEALRGIIAGFMAHCAECAISPHSCINVPSLLPPFCKPARPAAIRLCFTGSLENMHNNGLGAATTAAEAAAAARRASLEAALAEQHVAQLVRQNQGLLQVLMSEVLNAICWLSRACFFSAGLKAVEVLQRQAVRVNATALEHGKFHSAVQSGLDVPMLEDLIPLEDLHDPFLEDWASSHALSLHLTPQQQPQQPPQQQHTGRQPHCATPVPADPSDFDAHCAAPVPADPSDFDDVAHFSPSVAGLCGVPPYAEPDSPAAAMLNNAGSGQVPALVLGGTAAAQPATAAAMLARASRGAQPPSLPLPSGAMAVFGQQHAYAAAQVQAAASASLSAGLPPAIAAAQHRAAAAAVQMQLAACQQLTAQAQQLGQPGTDSKPVLVQLQHVQPVQPVLQAQQANKPSSSDGVAGGSRCSNASHSSTRQTAAVARNSLESSGHLGCIGGHMRGV